MKKLLILSFLIISCDNPENHGNLSIFETPSSEQFDKWLEIDSVYIDMVTPMVKVYKGSAKLNFMVIHGKIKVFNLNIPI